MWENNRRTDQMAEYTNNVISTVSPDYLCGRLDIFSSVDVLTAENVVQEVNSALEFHNTNIISED